MILAFANEDRRLSVLILQKILNLMSPLKSDKEAAVIRWKLMKKEDGGGLLVYKQLCD